MLRRVSRVVNRNVIRTAVRAYCTPEMGFDTKCLHAGYEPDATNAAAVPIYRTSSYVFNDTDHAANLFALKELGNIYTRLMNPTQDILEKRVAMLEGGAAAMTTASGQCASFYSIFNTAQAGDNVVLARNMYGGTHTLGEHLLPKMGIETRWFDPSGDLSDIDALVDSKTRCVFSESVSNPALIVTDTEALANKAHSHNLPLIIDETFATPYLCRSFEYGADIVMHSLTKWMGGHGTGIGGIVIDSGRFDWANSGNPLYTQPDGSYHGLTWGTDLPAPLAPLAYILRLRTVPLRTLGGCISPDNAWMFLQGLETLSLRVDRHCENALAVAKYLKQHPAVEWVRYPGLEDDPMFELQKKYLKGKGGPMVVFELKGGLEGGKTFINNLKIFRHLANVGDAKSLAIHSASTTHSQLKEEDQKNAGITPGMVRLSIGIETISDIIADLDQAIKTATGVTN